VPGAPDKVDLCLNGSEATLRLGTRQTRSYAVPEAYPERALGLLPVEGNCPPPGVRFCQVQRAVCANASLLKYVSDAFEERHAELAKEAAEDPGVDPEDLDEYARKSVYWLPPPARWAYLRNNARSPEIGKKIDEAMKAIKDGDRSGKLRGVLPRDYSRPALDKARLSQLIDRFSNLGVGGTGHQSKDTPGRVYE
jgi:type I restriction-modification system DNA methylase subunit